jgi:hypothetical protein
LIAARSRVATRRTSDTTAEVCSAPTIFGGVSVVLSMPKKRQTPAPKGVPWDPDIYEINAFVSGIDDLRTTPESPMVPLVVTERLAGLARIRDKDIFQAGIEFSVRSAKRDFPLLSSPVYRGKLLEQLDGVERAARSLQNKLQALENPKDRTTLWAANMIGPKIIAPYLRDLSTLIDAMAEAKGCYPYVLVAKEKGTPSGAGESGMALTRFVAHLGFAALAAGGGWTLNKNEQSGTLVLAIEKLRDFLPSKFLPPSDQHPYSTYQRILTDARSEWNLGRFPWPEMDQK